MAYDRRPPRRRPDDRRPGGPDRYRPPDRGPDRGGDRPYRSRPPYQSGPRPPRGGPPDEGGMSIRLDPRHLGTLRALASEAGVRPGELVTIWVTERLDAERSGAPSPTSVGPVLESLNDRIEVLSRRLDALEGGSPPSGAEPTTSRRRGRPPKGASQPAPGSAEASAPDAPAPSQRRAAGSRPRKTRGKNPAVPLHEEIAAVLAERGPLTAAELATAVTERGIYAPPRSSKPLDATAVSVRVSNPRYRSRFTRAEGKIGLA
jgi:hypothetical protein